MGDILFKGYVPTKQKKCLMKFKDVAQSELMRYDQVKLLPEYAGILNENVVLIDVDDYEQSEILMTIVEDLGLRCRVYGTSRGKHFLFLNDGITTCKTHAKLACGLVSDIKIGSKNSYSVLKYGDKEREIIYDIFEDEEYQTVPKWLFPVRSSVDFLTMESGDGRNQALFNYILTLQSNDFNVNEARFCINIINKYVLKEPLDESELEVVLRDDAFKAPVFFNGKEFLFDKFARYLIDTHHIIKINKQLHIYKDGIYVNDLSDIESKMIQHISKLSKQKRNEVMSYIDISIRKNTERSNARYIAFRNGVFDIETGEFTDFSPNYIITNKINFNYNDDIYSEIVDRTLDKLACGDDDIRALLEEVIGYCFYTRNELRKSFILIGDKANGKSTFLDMIKTVLGDENTSALDLGELGDRFKTAELFGVLANIGDDIGDEFIANPAIFKKIVSGDRINAERKGQNPFDFNPYCKLLFSANNLPRIKDKSGAVLSRLIIVPFNAQFSADDEDYDPYIKYKLRQEENIEYMIQLGLKGVKRVLDNNAFTKSDKVQKELEEYNENNNPIVLFFQEIEEMDIVNQPAKFVYQKYGEFCLSNNFQAMSNIEFSKIVKKYYGVEIVVKRFKDKTHRVFVKINE